MNKIKKMEIAITQAKKSLANSEVPVGCAIFKESELIAIGYNNRESENDVFGHAEIMAIKNATKKLKTWKLSDCQLFVTMEPCLMCYGAIKQARLKNIYIGTKEIDFKKNGYSNFIKVDETFEYGILENEAKQLMQDFFKLIRGKDVKY